MTPPLHLLGIRNARQHDRVPGFRTGGASIGVSLTTTIVNWGKVGQVISAIIYSILLSALAGYLIQRAFRSLFEFDMTYKTID